MKCVIAIPWQNTIVFYTNRRPEIMEIPLKKWVVTEDKKFGTEAIKMSFTNNLEVDISLISRDGSSSGKCVRFERNKVETLIADLQAVLEYMPKD
jgi:hypothetical protein